MNKNADKKYLHDKFNEAILSKDCNNFLNVEEDVLWKYKIITVLYMNKDGLEYAELIDLFSPRNETAFSTYIKELCGDKIIKRVLDASLRTISQKKTKINRGEHTIYKITKSGFLRFTKKMRALNNISQQNIIAKYIMDGRILLV